MDPPTESRTHWLIAHENTMRPYVSPLLCLDAAAACEWRWIFDFSIWVHLAQKHLREMHTWANWLHSILPSWKFALMDLMKFASETIDCGVPIDSNIVWCSAAFIVVLAANQVHWEDFPDGINTYRWTQMLHGRQCGRPLANYIVLALSWPTIQFGIYCNTTTIDQYFSNFWTIQKLTHEIIHSISLPPPSLSFSLSFSLFLYLSLSLTFLYFITSFYRIHKSYYNYNYFCSLNASEYGGNCRWISSVECWMLNVLQVLILMHTKEDLACAYPNVVRSLMWTAERRTKNKNGFANEIGNRSMQRSFAKSILIIHSCHD